MSWYRFALAVSLAAMPAAGFGQARPSEVAFALTRMELDLRVDYSRRALGGIATLHLRNLSTRAFGNVPLLLNRVMTISRVTDPAGAPLRYSQDVVVFEDDSIRQVNASIVTLAANVGPGDSATIVVQYGGALVGYTETGSLYVRDKVSHDFTIIRDDAYAFPALGLPSWGAMRTMRRDPFAFHARVTVPGDQVVAMGGRQVGTARRDSLVTWTYQSDGAVPFLNITIAPYRVLDGNGLRIFYFPADSVGGRMVERAVAAALGRYTAWYGTVTQDLHLTIIEIPEGFGSQASLTAGIIETADAFRDKAQLHQLYHELSHLWNPPDLDVASPRWNEGLASFLESRMASELDGWNGWDAEMARLEKSLRGGCEPRRPCGTVPFKDYGAQGLTGLSYSVGEIMFYALYKTLGADAFDRAYAGFFQQYRERGATIQDLATWFGRADRRSDPILADWYATTRWHARLAGGESLEQILNGYLRR